MSFKISRRKFISSSGAVFTLPLLECMFGSTALAQAAADPRRYVGVYFPNGSYNRADKPIWATGIGALTAANTSLALSPFAANYADLLPINLLKNDAWLKQDEVFADEHQSTMTSFMTCADRIVSTTNSFDQALAAQFNKPALVLSGGLTSFDQPGDRFVSYKNGVGDPGISNPGDLYRRLLGMVVPTPPPTTPPASASLDKSVLDSSIADFNSYVSKLGKADRAKMDEFLTAVRNLERKVASTPVTTPTSGNAACVAPTLAANLDNNNSRDTLLYLPKFYAMNDMIKIAFACDITRSVSIMTDTETTDRTFAKPPANLIYQGADISGGFQSHIAISHASGLNTEGYNLCVTRDRVLMQIVIDLVNKLKASNDPSGSRMLDNTVIECGFGVQDGNHSDFSNRRPLVLAGGKNFMTPGAAVTLANNQKKDLYYTLNTFLKAGMTQFQGSTTLVRL